ncbi:START domain-containing protein [uncultured Alcanivorax sp.]|uniref:START domain-containing protein n=1 Tax=uncultured Alcanivorax sp. TaxID=191215 RepID=UPI00260EA245|nr:START domain-containing protein [uncultured Alcanivorax sp.]
MIIKRFLLGLLLLGGSALSVADTAKWVLVTDRDGIQVYRQDDDSSRLKTFRGVGLVPVADFNAIGALMDDYEAVASFMHMVSEIRDLHRASPYQRDVYVTTRLPWPVKDRDAPLRVTFYQEPDSYDLVMPFSLNPEVFPEQSDYVRMPQMEGYYRFEPLSPGEVKVTIEVILDPGGAIPAWLANIILRDIPYFSLRRLRRVVNLPRFQGISHGYYQTPESWQEPEEKQEVANASAATRAPSAPR